MTSCFTNEVLWIDSRNCFVPKKVVSPGLYDSVSEKKWLFCFMLNLLSFFTLLVSLTPDTFQLYQVLVHFVNDDDLPDRPKRTLYAFFECRSFLSNRDNVIIFMQVIIILSNIELLPVWEYFEQFYFLFLSRTSITVLQYILPKCTRKSCASWSL